MKAHLIWSPRALREYRLQVRWLETNRDAQAVLRYMHEVADALDRISTPEQVLYHAAPGYPSLRYYPLNSVTNLYYRGANDEEVELVAFFDTRQNPNKLRLG